MNKASLTENLKYNDTKPEISLLIQTSSTKEIRIAMQKGQVMKEHSAPFPIVVEVFEGIINFGVQGAEHLLEKGSIIALNANVPHDLKCIENSIVRLSLSISDSVKRVENV